MNIASSKQYDVFLSHNRADKDMIETIAEKLRQARIEPFLDRWHLIPGEPWQEALEQALNQSRTCVVFIGPHGLGPWENEEMRSALEERVHNPQFRVIPVLLPGAQQPMMRSLPAFMRRLAWVEFEDDLDDAYAFHCLRCGIRGEQPNASRNHFRSPTPKEQRGELAAHTINRDKQEKKIESAIWQWFEEKSKLVVYLAYGDEYQCHHEFAKRLEYEWLPRFLGLSPIKRYSLFLSKSENFHDLREELRSELRKELRRDIGDLGSKVTDGEMSTKLAEIGVPALICVYLYEQQWMHHGIAAVREILHYWQDWATYQPKQPVFIFLHMLHCRPRQDSRKRRIWWPWLRAQPMPVGILMKQVYDTLDGSTFDHLICAPLPPLSDIPWPDVERWMVNEGPAWCRGHEPRAEMRKYFEQLEFEQVIHVSKSMEEIVKNLDEVMNKYHHQGEHRWHSPII